MGLWNSVSNFASNFGGLIGGIASGGMSIAGQNSANAANRDIANATNAANAAIAQKQMDFQSQQSSTSWQRGVADMKAAGINPMLAASSGGASTPSGVAIGAVTGAPMQNTMSDASHAFTSAINARTAAAQLDQIKEQTRKTMSDIDLNNVYKLSALADAKLKDSNALIASKTARAMDYAAPGQKFESELDSSIAGKFGRLVGRFNPLGHSASAVKRAFFPLRAH